MKEKSKIILCMIGILLSILIGYYYIIEKENIEIDKYNFEQLYIVNTLITNDKNFNITFSDINTFNSIYNANIEPVKNCYYISKNNGNEKYIFGFKLESLLYKAKYKSHSYAYPKYDIPLKRLLLGFGKSKGEVPDLNLEKYIDVISNPCIK